jgi:hypothetical protein
LSDDSRKKPKRDKDNLYPLRGSKEDWSVENEQEMLQRKKNYYKEITMQQRKGPPDFSSIFTPEVLEGSKVEFIKPVKFTPDKEYRPSFSLLEQIRDGTIRGPAKDKLLRIKMDAQTESRARDQVLVRLMDMTILDWKSWFSAESNIYVITTVVDDDSKSPFSMELKAFPHVRKGDALTIGRFGVKMYQKRGKVPDFLDMRILVARSKQGIRDAGEALEAIRGNTDFENAVQTLSSLVTGPIGKVTSQADTIVGLIGAILKLQDDDQILYYPVTVSKDFDNLGIGKKCDDTKFVKFCYQIQAGGGASIEDIH